MTIGERMRDARKAKGLTQAALAEKVRLKRNTIANYETNNIISIHTPAQGATAKPHKGGLQCLFKKAKNSKQISCCGSCRMPKRRETIQIAQIAP